MKIPGLTESYSGAMYRGDRDLLHCVLKLMGTFLLSVQYGFLLLSFIHGVCGSLVRILYADTG